MTHNGGYRMVFALTGAGLLSGLSAHPLIKVWDHLSLQCAAAYIGTLTWFDLFLPGVVFGVAIGACLLAFRIFRPWQSVAFIGLAGFAYFLSVWAAYGVAFVFRGVQIQEGWSLGGSQPNSPVSMFGGGAVGGFLVLGGAALLLRARIRLFTTLAWTLSGGVLGVVGWLLAPSLGTAIWRLFYAAHITVSVPPPVGMSSYISSITYQGVESFDYCLFAVWQAGMGLILGVLVRRPPPKAQYAEKGTEKEMEKP